MGQPLNGLMLRRKQVHLNDDESRDEHLHLPWLLVTDCEPMMLLRSLLAERMMMMKMNDVHGVNCGDH